MASDPSAREGGDAKAPTAADPAPDRPAPNLAEFTAHEVPPVEILFGRWLFLGCACTLAVVAIAFLAFVGAVAWGVLKQ